MYSFIALCAYLLPSLLSAGTMTVDEILAILPHADGNILIYASDLRDIDGRARTFREVVIDGLMELKARDLKMATAEATPEEMVSTICKRYGITRDQLYQVFEDQGYIAEEIPEVLKRRHLIDSLMGAMIRTEEPSKDEITAFYEANPSHTPARYTIQLATVSTSALSRDDLDSMIKTGKELGNINWNDAETYADDELSEEQAFVRTMKVGDLYLMSESEGSYDIIKLIAKQEKQMIPLSEGLIERISMQLRQKKFMGELKKFQDNLLSKARISFCNPEYAKLLNETVVETSDDES